MARVLGGIADRGEISWGSGCSLVDAAFFLGGIICRLELDIERLLSLRFVSDLLHGCRVMTQGDGSDGSDGCEIGV